MTDTRTIARRLKKLISNVDYGTKYRGTPIHCNPKEEILAYFNRRPYRGRILRFLSSITRAKLDLHFENEATLYFTGNPLGDSLAMIDIDCHNTGTLEGATAFAQYLQHAFFPGLYFEPSTNGNGVHGYFILKATSASISKERLKKLESVLNTIHGFDIEHVELKGQAPVITRTGNMYNITCGGLAKVPRELPARFDDFNNTTSLTLEELDHLTATILHSTIPPTTKDVSTSLSSLSSSKKKNRSSSGSSSASFSGKMFSPVDLRLITTLYTPLAERLMGQVPITCKAETITGEDIAIFLMILRKLSNAKHLNPDGTMPTARFRALWQALYDCGDVNRQFSPRRFTAIRNYLSERGWILFNNNHYLPGVKAMQWVIDPHVEEVLLAAEKQEADMNYVDVVMKSIEAVVKPVPKERWMPVRGRERPIWEAELELEALLFKKAA